jgi:hypothetical protein
MDMNRIDLMQMCKRLKASLIKEYFLKFAGFGDKTWCMLPSTKVKGVWRPPARNCVINGSLDVQGNIITVPSGMDDGFLLVFGEVKCVNYLESENGTTAIRDGLSVKETIYACSVDASTVVGGRVSAEVIMSGRGSGWLTVCGDQSAVKTKILDDHIEFRTKKAAKDQTLADVLLKGLAVYDKIEEAFIIDEEKLFRKLLDNKSILR